MGTFDVAKLWVLDFNLYFLVTLLLPNRALPNEVYFNENSNVPKFYEPTVCQATVLLFSRIYAADLPYGWIDKCLDFCDKSE